MLPAVLIIGELNVDIVLSGLATPPTLGSEVIAEEMHIVLGSASAIFAHGIARLGHRVGFVGLAGGDQFGNFCRQELMKAGIDTSMIHASRQPTGATVVLSTREDRALVTHLGAIAELGYDDLPPNVFEGYRHLHLTSYFLQRRLRPDFTRLMCEAKSRGLSVSFDPNSDPAQAWSPDIWQTIAAADVVFLNASEAKALSGASDIADAIAVLADKTACAVVKEGKDGATAVQGGETVHIDGFHVRVADTTGAGDSFAAGFVHGLLTKRTLPECLMIANAAGAISATGVGGTAAQSDTQTLLDFLGGHGAKLSM